MKRIATFAAMFALAACGARSETAKVDPAAAAPAAAPATAVAAPAAMDSARKDTTAMAAPAKDTIKKP